MSEILVLRSLKVIVVILGTILVYLSYKGYARSKEREFLFLAVGFSLITIGSVAAGVLFEFLGFGLLTVNVIESLMVVLGFLSLIYSIYR